MIRHTLFALALLLLPVALGCDSGSKVATLPDGSADVANGDVGVDGGDVSPDLTGDATVGDDALDGETAAPQTTVLWETNGGFFDRPWPELTRLTAEGTPALLGFPNPSDENSSCPAPTNQLLALVGALLKKVDYRNYLIEFVRKRIKGFGTNTPLYLRFSEAIDPALLPSPQGSLDKSSALMLVNVSKDSPRKGTLVPILVKLLQPSKYVPSNVVGVLPYPGFPLAPGERYALVVRKHLRDMAGEDLAVSAAFADLTNPATAGEQAQAYRDALQTLATSGIATSEIVAMSVFDVGDPAAPLRTLTPKMEQIDASNLGVQVKEVLDKGTFYRISGTLNTVFYQKGEPPYLPEINVSTLQINWSVDDDSGRLLYDDALDVNNSDVTKPRLDRILFALSLPKSAVAGLQNNDQTAPLPYVVYGHGTGGSRYTFITNGVAKMWAELGIAGVSINAVVHHERAKFSTLPADLVKFATDLGFYNDLKKYVEGGNLGFNVLNLQALAGNIQQSAIDYAWLAHAFRQTTFDVTIGDATITLRFSPEKVYYTGHSQGAITGPLTVFSTALRAYFFSAGAGHMTLWTLTKTAIEDGLTVKELAQFVICDDQTELDLFHPVLALYQLVSEPIDQMNFDPYLFKWPLTQRKHVMALLGIGDNWTPSASVGDATTTAMGLTHVGPKLQELTGQSLLGKSVLDADLSGNYVFDNLAYTGGLKQYECGTYCDEGHFVLFYVPEAQADFKTYFETLLKNDAPTVPY